MELSKKGDWFSDLRVFVYGTLKPGGRYWPAYCEGKVATVRDASVNGRLYELSVGYPALTLGGDERVEGCVLEFLHADGLRGLDFLEGFNPLQPNAPGTEYTRCRTKALIGGEEASGIWTYVMSEERIQRAGGQWIVSGKWQE
ncbi:MAG: gamma-glutamylcyclotransferase family protein [Verrucomicrobiota bacterium]